MFHAYQLCSLLQSIVFTMVFVLGILGFERSRSPLKGMSTVAKQKAWRDLSIKLWYLKRIQLFSITHCLTELVDVSTSLTAPTLIFLR